jgi:hypothetical protein
MKTNGLRGNGPSQEIRVEIAQGNNEKLVGNLDTIPYNSVTGLIPQDSVLLRPTATQIKMTELFLQLAQELDIPQTVEINLEGDSSLRHEIPESVCQVSASIF